jgi:hypothetical protein
MMASSVVYVVTSPNGDLEVLDAEPRWDWEALGQTVYIANVNGGDSNAGESIAMKTTGNQLGGIYDHSVLGNAPVAGQSGGLSGEPLHPLSVKVIAQLRAELGKSFPIVGVGGIVNSDLALATLRAGANLIQVYTGFAYRGAALLEDILGALAHD